MMSNEKTMNTKTIICTTCPSGCEMTVKYSDRSDIVITGNRCKKGMHYAENECFDPKRTYTGSVKISGNKRAMLPVRSASPVPKDALKEISNVLKDIELSAPVGMHDVILKDVLGTGVDIVSSMTLDKEF